jgi:uridine phosphorylase
MDGRIYHLNLRPDELASSVLLVGDPERVPLIADEWFSSREIDMAHRGLRTITGRVRETGQRVSLVTSGMGTPSLEIVLGELYALSAIDLVTRTPLRTIRPLTLIRVGTSGALQPATALGTAIVTTHAIGLDNTALFYDVGDVTDDERHIASAATMAVRAALVPGARRAQAITAYATTADPRVVDALAHACEMTGVPAQRGVTVSSSGFFANQGRAIFPFPIAVPDIDLVLANLNFGASLPRCENMEMESSFLLHWARALGFRAGAICLVIAHRPTDTFAEDYLAAVRQCGRAALLALAALEKGMHE